VDVADNDGGGVELLSGATGTLIAVKSSIQNGARGLSVTRSVAQITSTTDLSGSTADARVGTLDIDTWAVNFRGGIAPFGVNDPLTNSSLQEGSGGTAFQNAIRETTEATVNVTKANQNILADATAGAVTVNLPPLTSCVGLELTVKKTDVSANAVTVDAAGGDLIDGAGTFPLAAQYDWVTIIAGTTAWHVTSTT
jgi:hypothetical protein